MKITTGTPIVIYGAGEVGNNAALMLINSGYCVQGFLDAKPDSVKTAVNVPVYGLGCKNPWKETEVVVIIALANGNIHKDVAEKLFCQGYVYMVFLPIGYALPRHVKRRLILEYNQILMGKCENVEIFSYKEYNLGTARCKDAIIKEDEEFIWTLVPQEILFSENYDTWKGDKEKLTGIGKSYNRNITLRKWYRSLFRYFEGEIESIEQYFEIFHTEKDEEEKKNIICERQKLYQMYKMEFRQGLDFFIDSAPLVEWNYKSCYFNLVGGHHRTVFLLEQGLRMYPVKMIKSDFEKWCNYDKLKVWEEYVNENSIRNWNMPIPHPIYMNFIFQRENMKQTLMDKVLNHLEEIDISDMSVLDISETEGYFARIFSRLCAGRIICFAPYFIEGIEKLFALLYINGVEVVDSLDSIIPKFQSDIVFALNPNASIYKNNVNLVQIIKSTKKFLFIEINDEERERLDYFQQKGEFQFWEQISLETIDGKKYGVYLLIK